METTIITISDPISVGFWLTIGATLAGVVITVLLSLAESKGSYPLVIASSYKAPCSWGVGNTLYGRDFSLTEVKTFIKNIKAYAAQIWTTAEKELKNV